MATFASGTGHFGGDADVRKRTHRNLWKGLQEFMQHVFTLLGSSPLVIWRETLTEPTLPFQRSLGRCLGKYLFMILTIWMWHLVFGFGFYGGMWWMRSFSLSPFPQGNFPGQVCVFCITWIFSQGLLTHSREMWGGLGGISEWSWSRATSAPTQTKGQLGCQDHSTKQEGQIDGMELYDIIYVYYTDLWWIS